MPTETTGAAVDLVAEGIATEAALAAKRRELGAALVDGDQKGATRLQQEVAALTARRDALGEATAIAGERAVEAARRARGEAIAALVELDAETGARLSRALVELHERPQDAAL